MSFARTVAWRFTLKGTEAGKFSPLTLIAWLAIGVGTAAMSCLLGVMYGFESSLRDKVLKAYPHVIVRPQRGGELILEHASWTEKLRALEGVVTVMPYLDSEMILQAPRRTLGGVVWGIPKNDFAFYREGITEGAVPNPQAPLPELVMGSELAVRLGVDVGDEIKIVSPMEKGGMMGMVPRAGSFRVSGLYTSGHYEFDQQFLFLLLEDAQDLLRVGDAISGWHIWGKDVESADSLAAGASKLLPEGWEAASFSVFNAALFSSLKLEQYAMFTILSFAVAIAAMNIVITLLMYVTHKRRNIGVLRALGASTRQVRRLFLWQGALLGGVGLLIGAVLTVGFIIYVRYFSTYQLPEVYYDRTIPIEIRPLSLALIYGGAVVMILLSTIYPALQAAKLDPVEAIRE